MNSVVFVPTSRLVAEPRLARRYGFSLLEMILAIAILGGALVVIGHLVNIGYRSATEARIRHQANILADTKMAEVSAGVIELNSVSGSVIEEDPDWLYAVNVEPSDYLGLLMVTVTVQQTPASAAEPVSLSLTRFMPDPDFDPTTLEDPQ